jgi:hypothetical protein
MSPALSESYRTDAAMPAGRSSVEGKPRQNAGDRGRLLIRRLNPDPLPNHFGNFIDAGRIAALAISVFPAFNSLAGGRNQSQVCFQYPTVRIGSRAPFPDFALR